jgi:hypothetical protein
MTTTTMSCVNLIVGTAATIVIQKSTNIVTLVANASLRIKLAYIHGLMTHFVMITTTMRCVNLMVVIAATILIPIGTKIVMIAPSARFQV